MTSLNPVLVEICVDSLASAVAADRGGADRVELCAELPVGGVTPSMALVREVRNTVKCKLHVLVRPRAGDFVYSPEEIATMMHQIDVLKALSADGVVLGALDRAKNVDMAAMPELVKRARPMSVTFHRAFDQAPRLESAFECVIAARCDRILTSGGSKSDGTEHASAIEGARRLRAIVRAAAGRIGILAGGGVRENNVRALIEASGVAEVHTSLNDRASNTVQTAVGPAKFVVHEYQVKQFVAAVHGNAMSAARSGEVH
jgi:copper homeostasis protein